MDRLRRFLPVLSCAFLACSHAPQRADGPVQSAYAYEQGTHNRVPPASAP